MASNGIMMVMDARANKFWDGFSASGKERLQTTVVLESHNDHDYLFHEGDPADGVCMVLSGDVEVLRRVGNQEHVLGHFGEGEFLGEVAVLDGGCRSACARAHGAVTIGKIPKALLMDVLLQEPAVVTLRLFQQMLGYLRHTNTLFAGEVLHKEKLSVVGEMASSLMHDLRNPLTGIRLAADLMALKDSVNDETIRCCDGIRFQCDRIMGMTRDLLHFSKGDTGLQIDRTTTTAFLYRFQALHEDYLRESGIRCEIVAEPADIEIDDLRCLRLLQNLLTNAVEALIGTPGAQVQIRGWVEEGMFNLSVADNGPGIPAAIRDRVFQPFVTHGKKGGIGLGMAIVNNVVNAHHGKVKLETSETGTRFLIQLPQYATLETHPAVSEESVTQSKTLSAALLWK
jgi:signal transduction histidine kinase